jgi:hypothetical protein
MTAGRCAWEVRAGIIPGQAMPEHTRLWGLTSAEWEGPDGLHVFIERQAAAQGYAAYLALLSSQGREVNWVEATFIWF